MSHREIRNAVIKRTELGYEDHGILTAWLHLYYGSSGQGFGGFWLNVKFIDGVLKTVGVQRWEDLAGKHLRADCDHGKVYRIGHIVEDKWFDPTSMTGGDQ